MTKKRCLMNYGTHSVPVDDSYRVTINPIKLRNTFLEWGYREAASLLYVWCISGKYRRSIKSLESCLIEDHANATKIIDLAFSRGVIQEKDGKICKSSFPGLKTIEDKSSGDGRADYKLNIDRYIDVYKAQKTSHDESPDRLAFLGCCISLVPYLNQKYGFLCNNPDETVLENIRPLKFREIGELIGVNAGRMKRFIDSCSEYLNYDAEKKIALGGIARIKNGRRVFMVNARFLYHRDTDPLILSWFWDEEFVIEDWDKKYA